MINRARSLASSDNDSRGLSPTPRPAAGRSVLRSPPTAVPYVSRRRSSFDVLSGLEGTYAVALTAPQLFTAVLRRDQLSRRLCRFRLRLSHKSATKAACCRILQRPAEVSASPTLIRRTAEAVGVTSASSLGVSPTPSTYATASGRSDSGPLRRRLSELARGSSASRG